MTYRGSCLCGQARYEFERFTGHVDHCHCTFCQKTHGAAFGSYAEVDPATFRWVGDTSTVARYQSSAHSARVFCRNCGSSLLADIAGGKVLAVTLGTLDGKPALPPAEHMFFRSRVDWFSVNDDLPRHDEYPAYMGGQFEPTPDR